MQEPSSRGGRNRHFATEIEIRHAHESCLYLLNNLILVVSQSGRQTAQGASGHFAGKISLPM